MDEKQAMLLCNAYVLSWFRYCLLIWMFCNRTLGKLIVRVQERCIKAIFHLSNLSVQEIMKEHNIDSIHIMHLRYLMVEVYKSLCSLNPEFMSSFFIKKSLSVKLRDSNKLLLSPARTIKYGTNSVHFRSVILWNSLPVALMSVNSLPSFKSNMKKTLLNCSCQLRRF